ncbi:hypothetical protein HanRHA438_Chr04g0189551 [Helianthus annuus]|nr:hypothetical protein HanRHA438_Chr04g0189551 [Helianthus annuus]
MNSNIFYLLYSQPPIIIFHKIKSSLTEFGGLIVNARSNAHVHMHTTSANDSSMMRLCIYIVVLVMYFICKRAYCIEFDYLWFIV